MGGAKFIADWIGRSTLAEDATVAEQLVYQFIGLLLQTPWWALIGSTVILSILTVYVFRITYERPVVRETDNKIYDLRSAPEVLLDFRKGTNLLIKPSQDLVLHTPDDHVEGVFRLFILNGPTVHNVEFSENFEYVGELKSQYKRKPNVLYEINVVAIKDGRTYRYFISDPSYILSEANKTMLSYTMAFS